jgi:hypothetical protein
MIMAARPYMPGYGLRSAGEGTGLQAGDFTGSPTRWDFER